MDFTLLKSFIAVADARSFSTAAQRLFISQQTLSKQIAKLEEELDTPLFIRSRPLDLTQDGISFLRTAKGIMHLKQQYEDSCSKNIGNGHFVHLGIEHSIARAIMPNVMPEYLQSHPDTYLKLNEASPELLQKAVTYDGVDLVIGSIYNPPETHETVTLCKKEMLAVVPRWIMEKLAGEALEETCRAFSQEADLRFFQDAPFIKVSRVSSGGRALSSYLKYYNFEPNFVCELTNLENGFQLANSGLGVFLYPKFFWDMLTPEMQEEYLRNIYVFPLPYLSELEGICAYYHKENGLPGKTRELLDVIERFFQQYRQACGAE